MSYNTTCTCDGCGRTTQLSYPNELTYMHWLPMAKRSTKRKVQFCSLSCVIEWCQRRRAERRADGK